MITFTDIDQALDYARVLAKPMPLVAPKDFTHHTQKPRHEKVVNSDVKWKPVNKVAALVVSRAPEWALPPAPPPKLVEKKPIIFPTPNKPKKPKTTSMKTESHQVPNSYNGNNHSFMEIRNGVDMVNVDKLREWIVQEINSGRLTAEVNPAIKAAKDARSVLRDLCDGMGGDMERFENNAKMYLETIRSKRMAMVAEASQIAHALREVRQFFIGGDYVEEMRRLNDFVNLCERLHALKQTGFLDKIADTMLSLSVGPSTNYHTNDHD